LLNTRQTIRLLDNAGDATFAGNVELAGAEHISGFDVADVDRDGAIDLVACDLLRHEVLVFARAATGQFDVSSRAATVDPPRWMHAADADGDGLIDVLVGLASSSGLEIWCLPGNGDGTFEDLQYLLTATQGSVLDVDGDGLVDFLDDEQGVEVGVHFNEGGFTFTGHNSLVPGQLLVFGDFDGTHGVDLLVRLVCEGPVLFHNDGLGNFTKGLPSALAELSQVADCNRDGAPDVAGSTESGLVVQLNDLRGGFLRPVPLRTNLPLRSPWSYLLPHFGDWNGDGAQDLVANELGVASGLSVLLNEASAREIVDGDGDGVLDECQTTGRQVVGDANQDGAVNLADPVWLLRHLFQGAGSSLPCSGRTAADPTAADLDLLDVDESGTLDLADAVGVLQFLFQGRRPTLRLGAGCLAMDGCPALCRKE
jgi:hypothetical protein